ncbi:MAG: hypothetical protein Roseis2KO_03480 [Roseivirga sp.]
MTNSNSIPDGKALIKSYSAVDEGNIQDTSSISEMYNFYEILLDNLVPSKPGVRLKMQFYVNGRFATDDSYTCETYSNDAGGNGAGSWKDTAFFLWPPNRNGPIRNGSNSTGLFGKINFYSPLKSNSYKTYWANIYAPYSYNGMGGMVIGGGGYLGNQDPVTGFQLFFDGDSKINSGEVKVYGWK